MRKRTGTQFNCFSPPVMIATIIIELSLVLYTVMRYKLNALGRLVVLTLVCLAGFQIAEYNVCEGLAGQNEFWSRLGFAFITVLPPLGVHMVHVLAKKPARKLVMAAYATMAAYISIYLFLPGVFDSQVCQGNYVIFHIGPAGLGGSYWLYYFGWMLTGITLGLRWLSALKGKSEAVRQQARTIQALIVGWLVFVVPTAVINILDPTTMDGIPSLMCGFAVIYALILGLYILPLAGRKKA